MKHFSKFMEDIDSINKPESRVDIAKKRFESQKQKSKEFFEQLINLENANQDLLVEAKKRLNRDLSE